MKILKYSIIAILVLLTGFFAIGWINPSFTYENEFEVEVNRELCWKIFTDRKMMQEWMLDLKQVTLLEGDDGEPGSVYEFHFLQNDEDVIVRERVTEVSVPESYTFELTAEVLHANTSVTFEDRGETTYIRSVTEVFPEGAISKSLFYLMSDTFQEQADLQYSQLRELIESKALNGE